MPLPLPLAELMHNAEDLAKNAHLFDKFVDLCMIVIKPHVKKALEEDIATSRGERKHVLDHVADLFERSASIIDVFLHKLPLIRPDMDDATEFVDSLHHAIEAPVHPTLLREATDDNAREIASTIVDLFDYALKQRASVELTDRMMIPDELLPTNEQIGTSLLRGDRAARFMADLSVALFQDSERVMLPLDMMVSKTIEGKMVLVRTAQRDA